ncbi:MAG TPA: site-specific integrase [Mycobacteriales bacterium]|nr:site-specific integrase [Mycobacteriales bacterium]
MADVDDRWHSHRPCTDGQKPCRSHVETIGGQKVPLYPTARHGIGNRWMARWRDPGKVQRYKSFAKKDPAEKFLDTVRADLTRGVYVDPAAGQVTLRAYAAGWLASRACDPSTHEAMELRFRLHIFPMLGDHPVGTLRPSTIQAWVAGLKVAPNYARTVFANLSAVLSAAVDDGMLGRNPCKAKSVRPPAAVSSRVVPWPAESIDGMRVALAGRYSATVDAGAGCGLRQGEVFGLAVEDTDFLRGVVHVVRQVKVVSSKLVFGPPKRGKTRDVPLPESVKVALAEHLRQHPARDVTLPWLPTGKPVTVPLVFTSRESNAVNRNYFNAHVWKKALRAAGVPDTRVNGFHALRHYYASVLLAGGVDIRTLAEFLGHSDPGFTLRVYTHLMPQAEDRARRAIDGVFGASRPAPCVPDVCQEGR